MNRYHNRPKDWRRQRSSTNRISFTPFNYSIVKPTRGYILVLSRISRDVIFALVGPSGAIISKEVADILDFTGRHRKEVATVTNSKKRYVCEDESHGGFWVNIGLCEFIIKSIVERDNLIDRCKDWVRRVGIDFPSLCSEAYSFNISCKRSSHLDWGSSTKGSVRLWLKIKPPVSSLIP